MSFHVEKYFGAKLTKSTPLRFLGFCWESISIIIPKNIIKIITQIWILTTGFWKDDEVWRDGEIWND